MSSPVDVSAADVWKGERVAAHLERTPSGVRFRYAAGYDGPPVATTLPLSEVRRPVLVEVWCSTLPTCSRSMV